MDLFAATGVDAPPTGRRQPARRGASVRTLRVPLFNHEVIVRARQRAAFAPSAVEVAAARTYAKKAGSPAFARQKETAVRNLFFEEVLGRVLGYTTYRDEGHTLAFEYPIRGGAVDAALGHFSPASSTVEFIAPVEVKGPKADLDAIPAGRGRSPVQQAWDYAIDIPGSRFVLVTNCVELRLYAFGRGRDAYEIFDLSKLDDADEHARLWLILHADRLLGGGTEALLRETDQAAKAITNDFYAGYKRLRDQVFAFLQSSADGPKLAPGIAIEQAQKTLDRILFIAFAQRTDLLPDGLLKRTAEAANPFAPKPIWDNFKGLFGYLNKGQFDLDITDFNGGLFAPDPIADALNLPEHLVKDLVQLGEWDYRREVPVTVLGHIFEQSITDLEKLRAESRGKAPPSVSKRKREGVVYTPDVVTRFLVERTLGAILAEHFAALLRKHAGIDALPKNGDVIPWRDGDNSERAFWRAYLHVLRELRVVDPACGSGAFLVAAFDDLAAEYRRVTDRLLGLGESVDFDPLDWIVTRNLHGVDLNPESVEITRLSLWLKTARRKHRLQNLEATIKAGDSLIDSAEYTGRPFHWTASFPDAFAHGGFDVVIGNPPYVRSETISALKPFLRTRYQVFDSGADLYCYFYEQSVSLLLKEGGRLGFISSGGFFKTAFGKPLRSYISRTCTLESGIDFGDARVFEGVTTYPVTITMRKQAPHGPYVFQFLNCIDASDESLQKSFEIGAFPYPSDRLSRQRWHFEPEALWKIRDRLESQSTSVLANVSVPVSGIKTGLTEAFVITAEQKSALVRHDARSEELVRPFTTGDDLEKWSPESSKSYLIFMPKGWTKTTFGTGDEPSYWLQIRKAYPAISNWLLSFAAKARARSDQGDFWWELRPCDYYELFDQRAIVYPEMSQGPKFSSKERGAVSNNKTFLIESSDAALLAFMNSRACWFLLYGICTALRGGKWRLELRADFLKDLPLPNFEAEGGRLAELGEGAVRAARERVTAQSAVRRRILDLAPAERHKLSSKLETWWELDFGGFLTEVNRAFKVDVPLRQRGEWERFLAENRAAVDRLSTKIETAEREIDAHVYRLFDLTDEEIALLESSLEGQY
jgi:hypothetical protein